MHIFTFVICPAGVLRRRLLHQNSTFVPPAQWTRTRQGWKRVFGQNTGHSQAVYESIRKIPTARTTEISVPSQPSIQFSAQNGVTASARLTIWSPCVYLWISIFSSWICPLPFARGSKGDCLQFHLIYWLRKPHLVVKNSFRTIYADDKAKLLGPNLNYQLATISQTFKQIRMVSRAPSEENICKATDKTKKS